MVLYIKYRNKTVDIDSVEITYFQWTIEKLVNSDIGTEVN